MRLDTHSVTAVAIAQTVEKSAMPGQIFGYIAINVTLKSGEVIEIRLLSHEPIKIEYAHN